MKKIGNIEFALGCPFFPDWETAEPTRSVVWHVTLMDGHTATLRIPENPDIGEAYEIARRMMPTMHHIAAPQPLQHLATRSDRRTLKIAV